jgi:SOS-response transcriptional repressor LexA
MVLADGVLSGQLGVWKGGMETTLEIFAFIRDYMALHLWAPTLREIADGCGLAHPSSVVRHLEHLEAWGLITREPGLARSIALTDKGANFSL